MLIKGINFILFMKLKTLLTSERILQSQDLYTKYTLGIPMTITTVKLHKNTKSELDTFREHNESYDQIIRNLIGSARDKSIKKKLEQGYRNRGEEDRTLLNEWEIASSELP